MIKIIVLVIMLILDIICLGFDISFLRDETNNSKGYTIATIVLLIVAIVCIGLSLGFRIQELINV